jgi:TonB family protein
MGIDTPNNRHGNTKYGNGGHSDSGFESNEGDGTRTTAKLTILMALALGVLLISITQAVSRFQPVADFFGISSHDNHVSHDRQNSANLDIIFSEEGLGIDEIELTELTENEPVGEVFMIVEQMPELIGGLAGLASRVKYPEIALQAGIHGRVFIQFVVDANGTVTDPVVTRGIGGGCDQAAVEALLQSSFIPGVQRGRNVAVKMSLPVVFKIE